MMVFVCVCVWFLVRRLVTLSDVLDAGLWVTGLFGSVDDEGTWGFHFGICRGMCAKLV